MDDTIDVLFPDAGRPGALFGVLPNRVPPSAPEILA